MRNRNLFLFAILALAIVPTAARGEITYPPGTTLEEAWTSPPRISAEAAVDVLSALFLAPHQTGTELEVGPEAIEALKYLFGNHRLATEEPPVQDGTRRYGGEILPETMTPEEADFFETLSLALSRDLGLAAIAPPDVCVKDRKLFEIVKYKWDVGWNEIDVWGLAAFGHNLQYGYNNSDIVYGVFPFGIQMGWWDGLRCVLSGIPDDEQELRACGREKEWKLQGNATMLLATALEHSVPGVAQASVPFAGSLATGKASTFQTNSQTRSTLDPTYALGPSNTPLPSSVLPTDLYNCAGPACPNGVMMRFEYYFSQVIAWHPNIVLQAGYNNTSPRRYESYRYVGSGEGNPHSIGNFYSTVNFSRFHEPFPACN